MVEHQSAAVTCSKSVRSVRLDQSTPELAAVVAVAEACAAGVDTASAAVAWEPHQVRDAGDVVGIAGVAVIVEGWNMAEAERIVIVGVVVAVVVTSVVGVVAGFVGVAAVFAAEFVQRPWPAR